MFQVGLLDSYCVAIVSSSVQGYHFCLHDEQNSDLLCALTRTSVHAPLQPTVTVPLPVAAFHGTALHAVSYAVRCVQ